MLLIDLIGAFLAYVEHERGSLCPRNYERDLLIFARYAFENSVQAEGFSIVDSINDTKLIRRFLAEYMLSHDRKSASRILGTLKTFFKFLQLEGFIGRSAAAEVRFPKSLPDKLPPHLKASEINAILELEPTNPKELRTRAIVELLYSTGIRASELQRLSFNNLDLEGRTIQIRAKGGRERILPFGFKAERALRAYFASWPEHYPKEGRAPLWRNGRKRLSLRAIQRAVKNLAIEALGEPGRRVTPLAIRHSVATHLMNNGAQLIGIRELLGHKSVTTTQKYTHVSLDRLKDVFRAAHPKEQFKGEYDEEGDSLLSGVDSGGEPPGKKRLEKPRKSLGRKKDSD